MSDKEKPKLLAVELDPNKKYIFVIEASEELSNAEYDRLMITVKSEMKKSGYDDIPVFLLEPGMKYSLIEKGANNDR